MTRNFEWWSAIDLSGGPGGTISAAVAQRQTTTAKEILRRFHLQPGVVLADEVGMGKTFVALAVAASTAVATRRKRPVVVMVPPSLKHKWPQEWDTFSTRCLPNRARLRSTPETVTGPSDFLRLFDDQPADRRHIAFVAHGALTRQLSDPWTRLAIIRSAFSDHKELSAHRRAFARWAARLIDPRFTPEITLRLLATPLTGWRDLCTQYWPNSDLTDDPVYLNLPAMLSAAGLVDIRDALASVPQNTSPTINRRLTASRKRIKAGLQTAWLLALKNASFQSPLLVLDEAHHLRHPTQVASLLTTQEARLDSEALTSAGALAGKFDRMLFLTATPFQMGHRELINVMSRFDAVRWKPGVDRTAFATSLNQLRASLDRFQLNAHHFEQVWGRLTPEDVQDLPTDWWAKVPDAANSRASNAGKVAALLQQQIGFTEQQLQPWVIRHIRGDRDKRRIHHPGDAIRPGGNRATGLAVNGDAILPFLLAARARTHVANVSQTHTRALFAGGLASSFEAYRETRRNRIAHDEPAPTRSAAVEAVPCELAWYLRWIDRSLPAGPSAVASSHPKMDATVARATELWKAGEKVLIFCFYIETGRALRRKVSDALEVEITRQAAHHLGIDPNNRVEIVTRLNEIGDNVLRAGSQSRREVARQLTSMAADGGLDQIESQQFLDVVEGFIRSESFLVRYLLPHGTGRAAAVQALEHPDRNGSSLRDRLEGFLHRMADLAPRQRSDTLKALDQIRTGRYMTLDQAEGTGGSSMVLPNVRLANGQVRPETRDMLTSAFRMPFFPEVLIASPVMAEGIDLHWECRTVIHHDLDWNPSALEQRNGRLDRIGSRAERTRLPMEIYEPFTTGLQDEKTYRVVTERGRWFDIVMGDEVDLSAQPEHTTDLLAARVPLPEQLVERLTLDLAVARSADSSPRTLSA